MKTNQLVDFASSLNQTPNYLEELQKRLHTMNSSSGQSTVNLLGYEIPIVRVSESVLPAQGLFIGPKAIAVTEYHVNTKEPSITSRITICSVKVVMVSKVE